MKNYINRYIQNFDEILEPGKAVVILGPRRTGKTTLINHYLEHTKFRYRIETGDNVRINCDQMIYFLLYLLSFHLFVSASQSAISSVSRLIRVTSCFALITHFMEVILYEDAND